MGSGFAAAAFAAAAHRRQRKIGCVPPAQAPMLLLLPPPPFSPSCCLCCGCRRCLAFLVLLLWLLPLMCSPPHVSFERKIVFRNTSSYFTALSFQAKGIALKIARCCFPALLACCIRREVEDKRKERGQRRHVKRKERAACRPVARSDRLRSRPRTWFAHQIGAALRWLSSAGRRGCLRGPFELPAAARRPPVEPPSSLADLIQPAS